MPPTSRSLAARLAAAAAVVARSGWDAFLVTRPSNLQYLTGVASSAGLAIVHGDGLHVVIDGRYAEALRERGEGREGVSLEVLPTGVSYEEAASGAVAQRRWRRIAVEATHMTIGRLAAIRRALPSPDGVEWVHADDEVERLRAVKDADEQAILRDAGRRLAAVAACILPQVSAGRSERDVAWTVAAALHDAGFERPAFDTIVASGSNAARPHHRAGERSLRDGDLVVVDFGGVLDGYSVDMTRTVNLGAPAAQAAWIDAVAEAQEAAFAAARPGAAPSAVDRAARAALAARRLDGYFTHSTGHGLGLDVHERPTIGPRGDSTGPLVSGMVFTIEPGVYVPGDGGVRIEDDVLVTATGAEWLTREAGRGPAA